MSPERVAIATKAAAAFAALAQSLEWGDLYTVLAEQQQQARARGDESGAAYLSMMLSVCDTGERLAGYAAKLEQIAESAIEQAAAAPARQEIGPDNWG